MSGRFRPTAITDGDERYERRHPRRLAAIGDPTGGEQVRVPLVRADLRPMLGQKPRWPDASDSSLLAHGGPPGDSRSIQDALHGAARSSTNS